MEGKHAIVVVDVKDVDPEPEALGFWQSREHEIDFFLNREESVEVKIGRAGALDFKWYPKTFAHGRLSVVCSTPFETDRIRGITLHDFLMEGPSRTP